MCGIAGIISLNGSEPKPGRIFSMTRAMSHRGPDGEGYLLAGGNKDAIPNENCPVYSAPSTRPIHFGHRRLSIVDLSAEASQPMTDISGKYWITFNGEIYNHREIRAELERCGQKFKTDHSDTEVILEAYKFWGYDCLQHFKGMFAFALWDTEQDLVWLVRDRFGKKPFYFGIKEGLFYFASEIKSILKCDCFKREMDLQAFSDYLSFTFVPPPLTLFKGISKMAAGHYMIIKNGHVSEQKPYYDVFKNVRIKHQLKEEEALEGFRTRFSKAIDLRRESDVPYGAYLSGGVDSSSVVAELTRLTGKSAYTFSVGFSNDTQRYKNEFEYARKVAKLFNTTHFEIELTEKDFTSVLSQLAYHQDEPLSDVACVPLYYLSKLARDNGIIVCLGGEGSDETFIGYEYWRRLYEYQKLNDALPILKPAIRGFANIPIIRKRRPYYAKWSERVKKHERIFRGGVENFTDSEKSHFFKPGFQKSEGIQPVYRIIEHFNDRYERESGGDDLVNLMSFIDLNLRLPELLLSRIDKMSMAASVEARAPFMDHELIEFSMCIPSHLKFKNKTEKYIIKKAMEDSLPNDILYRPKEGFQIPTFHFLHTSMKGYLKEKIDFFTKEFDFVNEQARQDLINVKDDRHSWYFMNLAIWWERFSKE
ncbi:MAG TPA: asparagine synthase (glutamine-hydrolyzing) [Bacteroidia bacterium]|nr:asparagine synthase (glutamine-hydrolyzing) [Bacteroidia bacterium]